ncbi:MAG TPA: PTS sugar transporter subunit IIB [Anaeromyxobacteraceae bacterium]|nr:PTS sugar transporter subunit IIB [Anaeromyxobacteraceae bacterium]
MISLVRVDNRLVHGQILETWLPKLGIRRLVVADDDAAGTPLARDAMCLCTPPDLPIEVTPVGKVDWAALAASREPVMVLVREVADLVRASEDGMSAERAPRLNVGNVHYALRRRPVTPSVFLDDDELAALRDLGRSGYRVEIRALPTDAALDPDDLGERQRTAR